MGPMQQYQTNTAVSQQIEDLAAGLYPHLHPLGWADSDRNGRGDRAIAAGRLITRMTGLPAQADPRTLDSRDFRDYLTSAMRWADPSRTRGVMEAIVGRFRREVEAWGAELASGPQRLTSQRVGDDTLASVWQRTGKQDLALVAAQAAAHGHDQATRSLTSQTAPVATGASAAPAARPRERLVTEQQIKAWQTLGTQLGGLVARLETKGLYKAPWRSPAAMGGPNLPDETPESVATKMDASVRSQLDLPRGDHLAEPKLIEEGDYRTYAGAAIRLGLGQAYPEGDGFLRHQGEGRDTIWRAFEEAHSRETRALQREARSADDELGM